MLIALPRKPEHMQTQQVQRDHRLIGLLPAGLQPFMRRLPDWAIQVPLFLLVGGTQVLIDWGVMVGLSWLGVGVVMANVTGRFIGAVMGFVLNGILTFGRQQERMHGAQLARFICFWLLMTAFSTGALALIAERMVMRDAWLAKPLVEAVLAVISFFASRHWIYK
jgi:putative flippase GtrA